MVFMLRSSLSRSVEIISHVLSTFGPTCSVQRGPIERTNPRGPTPIHKGLANQMGCSPDTVACHLHSLHGCRTHWIKVTNSSAPPSLPVCSPDARLLAETNRFHYWIVTSDKNIFTSIWIREKNGWVPTSKQHLESSQICIPATQWSASSQHTDVHLMGLRRANPLWNAWKQSQGQCRALRLVNTPDRRGNSAETNWLAIRCVFQYSELNLHMWM